MEHITDADLARLENAVILADEFSEKFSLFRHGFIPPEMRRFQFAAYAVYDVCSMRQREVFMLKLKQHTFKEIGEALGIGTSTAKVHWYRVLRKVSSVLV
jgi:DNA-binding CsgD family transcriptional regulator|tara:strand:- start:163 stop:462 length:300 start_codon:yes stop_codon:yes gene_type:complete